MVKKPEQRYSTHLTGWTLKKNGRNHTLVTDVAISEDDPDTTYVQVDSHPSKPRTRNLVVTTDVPQQDPVEVIIPIDGLADLLRANGYVVEKLKYPKRKAQR